VEFYFLFILAVTYLSTDNIYYLTMTVA